MLGNLIASIRILQMLTNIGAFEKWLKEQHNKDFDPKLFHGYKFFAECAFSEFFDYLGSEKVLGIEADFLFQRALGETLFIEKLPNTCEKVVFLKNIYSAYKPITKAKNSSSLRESMVHFQDHVLNSFDILIEKNLELSSVGGLTIDRVQQLILIENLYIHFSQVNNNGPVAYNGSLMKQFWLDTDRLQTSLDGYKYALQYVWRNVVDKEVFTTSNLKDLHMADSWKKYIYLKKKGKRSRNDMLFGSSFDLSVQTSLDSYFYRIREEIIHPLEESYQMKILNVPQWVHFKEKEYSKEIFGNLLSNNGLPEVKLTIKEELDLLFYWYPIEVFQSGQMHNGVSAFITSLAGMVTLLESGSEAQKVMVRKFIHPFRKKKNDYSYSIFIDSKASAGHYYSGWLLYFDCCSDYSGFSGSQYERAEEIIEKYKDQIELIYKTIEKETFKEYISKYISSTENAYSSEEQVLEQLDNSSTQRVESDKLGKARGIIVELLAYYMHSKYAKANSIEWSTEKSDQEIDLRIEYQDTVTIIECKVNPNNYDLKEEYQKALGKLNKNKLPGKRFEFWFWHEPSQYNRQWLINEKINYTVLSNNCTANPFLERFDFSSIKYVFS